MWVLYWCRVPSRSLRSSGKVPSSDGNFSAGRWRNGLGIELHFQGSQVAVTQWRCGVFFGGAERRCWGMFSQMECPRNRGCPRNWGLIIGVVVTGFMRCEKMRVPWVRDVARVVAVRHWSIGCIFCYVHSFPKCWYRESAPGRTLNVI